MGIIKFSLVLLMVFEIAYAQVPTDPNEVEALKKLIDYWKLGTKLNITIDPCTQNATWASENANPRVLCACTGTTCHITHLKIYALDISGNLPAELFTLKELKNLDLGQNVLNGSIPPEIGLLTNMEYLSLGINNFSGQVPSEFGNLAKLLSLSFSSNNFHGPLPNDIGKLTSLTQLYIDSSGVSGLIPQELSNLKSLKTLRLEGTRLQGPIPDSFGALTKLDDLRISGLSTEDSSLNFVENLTSLTILSLRNCRVAGRIPEKLGTFSNLRTLDLSFNKLTNQIPKSFQDFSSLNYLYLGSNNLSGALPQDIISPNLLALDVSFNSLSGDLPPNYAKVGLSVNVVGTSINALSMVDGKASGMLQCLLGGSKCSNKVPATSFSIKCGGTSLVSDSGIKYDDDSETLGAASLYTSSSEQQWAVSNTGSFISNPNGPQYIATTDSQITHTLESELYKSARASPSSLRYYGLGLKNGKYSVEIHFAEIQMDDSPRTWKGLGRRLFDVHIQGERVLEDFNIRVKAGGSKRALVRTFMANVTNTAMDIHLFWAGRGTCCIPVQSTFGPLVSAIHVSQVSESGGSIKKDKKRAGKIAGIAIGCAAGLVVVCSMVYLWWIKDKPVHMRIHTDSPRK